MRKLINLSCVILLISLIGCIAPPKIELLETIETNETAFLVPLEGETKEGQGKFMSIEYLEQAKIATKRISLPQRKQKIGRFDHEVKWIPTMRVIKINRAPVTREWTQDKDTGSKKQNQSIEVESKDSIGFSVGINITSLIKEEDSAKFLYYYAGKSLDKIIDENVRGYITSILSNEFGIRNLTECKAEKDIIQQKLEKETIQEFSKYGISITNIGLVGGLTYEEKKIQEAIDNAYVAEMSILEKMNALEAQKQENERVYSIAVTERRSAQEFEKAYQAMIKKIELDIEMKKADALLLAAQKWQGNTPSSILPQGSNFLFGLDSKNTK